MTISKYLTLFFIIFNFEKDKSSKLHRIYKIRNNAVGLIMISRSTQVKAILFY